jgi:mevalonate kinase
MACLATIARLLKPRDEVIAVDDLYGGISRLLGYLKSLKVLAALVRENHAHLVSLGVSHPVLEAIHAATAKSPHGFATKLTGASGGGRCDDAGT